MQIMNENTAYFGWEHLHPDDLPGKLGGYRISYWKYLKEDGTNPVVDTLEPGLTQRTIKTFRSFTWYRVEIKGFTTGGEGPPCVFIFKTPPGGSYSFIDSS